MEGETLSVGSTNDITCTMTMISFRQKTLAICGGFPTSWNAGIPVFDSYGECPWVMEDFHVRLCVVHNTYEGNRRRDMSGSAR